ncbi:hypothetical protein GT370_10295 [Acidocella sp. MX-AZ03]|uniref:hypothetical protein n=1 Tax=Acidocella sp. MX-AZ03 TaxID=2697363 RepID=UPI0022DE3D4F|nr:hypothetical protein [Acidocella sp. MX-AZ03]WBO61056.1 hypothetical protein GT370_10295 [Acidocella sp. MX-AZ03]
MKLVGDAGTALTGIVTNITNLDQLMADIASSAREQATGLAEVNAAVNQMDQVTQQNASMIEETNAAASNLQKEVMAMDELVRRFELGRDRRSQAAVSSVQGFPAVRKAAKQKSCLGANVTTGTRLVATSDENWDEF